MSVHCIQNKRLNLLCVNLGWILLVFSFPSLFKKWSVLCDVKYIHLKIKNKNIDISVLIHVSIFTTHGIQM